MYSHQHKVVVVCMDSVILPVVKNKGGVLTDVDNYRAIAISNVETKILETIFMVKFNERAECDMYQFVSRKDTLLDYVPILLKEPLITI